MAETCSFLSNTYYHNRKILTRKQRTDVGKYSFVNRTIRSWNQLPANLLVSFTCKLSTFRKRVKNVVTSRGIQVGGECIEVKWCEMLWCGVNWRDLCEVILFWSEVKWSEVVYNEVLADKGAVYIRVTLYWRYLFIWVCLVLGLFRFVLWRLYIVL